MPTNDPPYDDLSDSDLPTTDLTTKGLPTDELPDDHPLAIAYNRGLDLQKAGDMDGAAQAFREALELDPADHGGLVFRLAAMGFGDLPAILSPAYVATLFDQAADTFDETLVEKLGYAVPMLVRERIEAHGLGPWQRLLDLGCGTGLMGASLSDMAPHLTGIDLSEAILKQAAERECYDDFYVGDAVSFLNEGPLDAGRWDLITATDVLPYIGALEDFFVGVERMLAPGGAIVFSTETLVPDTFEGRDWTIGTGYRYAHHPDYIARHLAAIGCNICEQGLITVRTDNGEPVPGHLVMALRPE